MILKHNLLEQYDKYTFNIPTSNRDRIKVHSGDTIELDMDIYSKIENSVKYSFYLPDQLGCTIPLCANFVTCIDGEFVNQGDELAVKAARGGFTTKTLLAPANGIVDLSRLNMGYIDILGEEKEKKVKSNFKGHIIDVNPMDGIKIESHALALDLLAVSKTDKKTIFGSFTTLNTGKDVKLTAEDVDYEDRIVFVGKHLHMGLLKELFEKGAKFVLTYSMDYEDFRNQGLPVGVIGGFGEIYSERALMDKLNELENTFVVVDFEEEQLFFLTDSIRTQPYRSPFVKTLVGSKIVSHALGNYGMAGEVIDCEDSGYVTVEWENNARSIANIGSLEFVAY